MPIGLAVHQQVLTTANTDDIMPKEQRRASHSYRQDPLERAPEETFSHRSTSIWTAEDDEILLAARAQGMNWQPIAEAHFPSKSGNACRKRHERLLEKGKAEDWDTNKLEKLSEEYMAVRKEMWSVLAVILEEKWQNVEAKCMEKGLKNLMTLYKAATRKKRRGMAPHQHHLFQLYPSPKQDSGFEGSDTDAEYEVDYVPSTMSMTMTMPTTATMASVAASGGSSGYVSASSAFLQHHRTRSYQPILIQPANSSEQAMMMQTGATQRNNRGRNMSIHSMLSPSPPADEDDDQ